MLQTTPLFDRLLIEICHVLLGCLTPVSHNVLQGTPLFDRLLLHIHLNSFTAVSHFCCRARLCLTGCFRKFMI
jgi:hypothetical protein